ncbi:methionyl-tRNA formyltransferase, mitochondrial-like isoform X2 [Patiria miniata]|nr:methionyl-tRNA formyltransferase, mitochondrial-like isoform X2 [Patiria miniata]
MTQRKVFPLQVMRSFIQQSTLPVRPFCRSWSSVTTSMKKIPPACKYRLPSLQATAHLHTGQSSGDCDQADYSTDDVRVGPPWRVMFFGSDNFSISSLRALHKNTYGENEGKLVDTLHVVCPETKYIKRRGRTRVISPIWQYCHDNDLTTIPWPIRGEVKGYDVGVLSSFGHLVPGHLIDSFPYGIANIHPSLLPRWRGASPITHAILEGDKTTGVSIMRIMPKRFDVGPILLQESLEIPERSTTESLQGILASKGADMILRVLADLPAFIENGRSQTEKGVTLCGKVVASMSIIDWSQTSSEIDRLQRAIGHQFPLETSWHGNQIRLSKMADPMDTAAWEIKVANPALGEVHYDKATQQLCVWCKDGWVGFGEVTLKKKMTAQDFYNGYLSGKDRGRQYFV